jgi:hypothetical protein
MRVGIYRLAQNRNAPHTWAAMAGRTAARLLSAVCTGHEYWKVGRLLDGPLAQTTGTTTGDYHFEQSKLRSGAPVRLNTSFLSWQVTEYFTPFGRRVELTFDALKVTVSPDLL